MKKIILSIAIMIATFAALSAKPKAHVSVGFDVEVGRPTKQCKSVWLCIKNITADIELIEFGMIKNNHGIVIGDDGALYIAINSELVKKQDLSKYNSLMSGSVYIDSEEELPAQALKQLGYNGKNTFPAGKYKVSIYEGYFLIQLN